MSNEKVKRGSAGGKAVYMKYGREYMQKIGRKGYQVMHQRYDLIPYGTCDFAIVSKETGKIVALLSGTKIPESGMVQSEESANDFSIPF